MFYYVLALNVVGTMTMLYMIMVLHTLVIKYTVILNFSHTIYPVVHNATLREHGLLCTILQQCQN